MLKHMQPRDEVLFDKLFRTYYTSLCLVAENFIADKQLAEDIVQEVFIKIWDRKQNLEEI